MNKIITYVPNGRSTERFDSFAEARNEWDRFDPWQGGCKKELYRNGELWITNRYGED